MRRQRRKRTSATPIKMGAIGVPNTSKLADPSAAESPRRIRTTARGSKPREEMAAKPASEEARRARFEVQDIRFVLSI